MRHQGDGDNGFRTTLANERRIYCRTLTRLGARIGWRRVPLTIVPWLLAIVLLVGPNSPLAVFGNNSVALAQAFSHPGKPRGTTGTPNTFGAYLQQLQAKAAQPRKIAQASAGGPVVKAGSTEKIYPLQRGFRPSMKEGNVALTAGQAASFTSSDGSLRVTVPAGAITAEDVAAGGGKLTLRIDQVAGGSGATAGGGGEISFGTYLFQLLTAQGERAPFGLRAPLTVSYTYSAREQDLRLDKTTLVVNGPRPVSLPLAPLAASVSPSPTPTATAPAHPTAAAAAHPTATATTAPSPHPTASPTAGNKGTGGKSTGSKAAPSVTPTAAHRTPAPSPASTGGTSGNSGARSQGTASGTLGPSTTELTTLDNSHHTLSAPMPLTTSAATGDFDTFSSVGTFGSPDPFTTDLSGGGLTASFPVSVPPGPGGLTPPISLDYSSAAVSEQHNVQAAAGWVGEGWNMSLGAVTWSEHNVTADCNPNCGSGNWENSWQISDPYGMGADLIPPNNAVSTYYDDTINTYFDGTSYYNMPAQWHTSAENYAKIISYVGPNTIQTQAAKPPCFRAWLTNGIMEEFGCTTNALQYYETSSGDRLTAWYLDLITDPQGNQIHITYQADTTGGFPRDVELDTIQYDSTGCHNANTACTGSAWAPKVQIAFVASHTPFRVTDTWGICNTGTDMRCDDPLSLSHEPAPLVQSTFALDDIKVEVSPSGNGTWSTIRDYQLSYCIAGPNTYVDQNTDNNFSTAGEFVLTKLQLLDENEASSPSMPPETFGYTYVEQIYEDSSWYSQPGDCGWTWNEPGGDPSKCPLWSVNRSGNGILLSGVDNGMGGHTTFTWVPNGGHNNTHGVNAGLTISDPTACNGHYTQNSTCALADDQNWSRALLQSRTDCAQWIESSSTCAQIQDGGSQPISDSATTSYTYSLTHLSAYQCPNCTYGYDWGNQNDGDYLDYYDTTFMGYAETDVTNPDTSVVKHHYLTTEGIGVWSSSVQCYAEDGYRCYPAPWWDTANAGHGHETETDSYGIGGSTLLQKTTAAYHAVCPPSGVPQTPTYQGVSWGDELVAELDHNNPVAGCDVQETSATTTTYDGGSNSTTDTTATTYDTLGRVATTTSTVNGGSPTTVVHDYGYTQNSAISTSETSASGTYLIDFQAFEDTQDTANPVNRWSCTYTSYDGASLRARPDQQPQVRRADRDGHLYQLRQRPNYTHGRDRDRERPRSTTATAIRWPATMPTPTAAWLGTPAAPVAARNTPPAPATTRSTACCRLPAPTTSIRQRQPAIPTAARAASASGRPA